MLKPSQHPTIAIIAQRDYKRMTWKNGLGETLEIHRTEDADGLRFRISQAAVVENGVFSDFSGLHRTLVLLSGNGMKLSHKTELNDQIENALKSPLDMARFSGGDQTVATLTNGSIEDLNIMVRETDTKANVMSCTAPCRLETKKDSVLFHGFYANQSSRIQLDSQDLVNLAVNHLLIIKDNTNIVLQDGNGILIEILPL